MKRGTPTKETKASHVARLVGLRKAEPSLSPLQLAARLGMSHVTVRKYLRELDLYAHDPARRCRCCQ